MKRLMAVLALGLLACGPASPSGGIATPAATASPEVIPAPIPDASTAKADLCGQACVLNPQVTQATIATTICKSGWTKTIRPPVNYTDRLKVAQMAALHLPGTTSGYEEDHRLPLELGGDPRNPRNLTPEAHPGSSTKDAAENQAKKDVCTGHQPLAAGQAAFIATWLSPWPGYKK